MSNSKFTDYVKKEKLKNDYIKFLNNANLEYIDNTIEAITSLDRHIL